MPILEKTNLSKRVILSWKRVLFPCLLYISVAMYINILIYLVMRILNLMFLQKKIKIMQICIIFGVLLMWVGSIGGFWQIYVEAYAYKFYPNTP
jgi:vacuolar-type H+-ATPase subunit I/STV1